MLNLIKCTTGIISIAKILILLLVGKKKVLKCIYCYKDRLCGLVVRVSGYRYRGPGFDPRRYQIF